MPLLRFQLYTDPSRQSYSQIHPDISVSAPPVCHYGQPVQVGDDADDPATWPLYVVANLLKIKREADPEQPTENQVIYEVYLARADHWADFGEPREFEAIRNGTHVR